MIECKNGDVLKTSDKLNIIWDRLNKTSLRQL